MRVQNSTRCERASVVRAGYAQASESDELEGADDSLPHQKSDFVAP